MISFEHTLVDAASSPFCSQEIFSSGTQLNPLTGNKLVAEMWRRVEQSLLRQNSVLTLDEVLQIRDCLWSEFEHGDFLSLWKKISTSFLRSQGAIAVPTACPAFDLNGLSKADNDALYARNQWRWLTFTLPEDSLLVGLWDQNHMPISVAPLPHQLSEVLKRNGFSEVHLHLGAAVSFSDLWVGVSRRVGDWKFNRGGFMSPGGVFSDGCFLADWLLRGMIVRHIMAKFLASGSTSFHTFLNNTFSHLAQRNGQAQALLISQVINEVRNGVLRNADTAKLTREFRDLQQSYRQMVLRFRSTQKQNPFLQNCDSSKSSSYAQAETLEEFRDLDTIGTFFPPRAGISSEMGFLEACFNYLENSKVQAPPGLFQQVFWQYFRIRNIYYRHIVHDPSTPGLTTFIRSYNRISPALGLMSERAKLQSAARLSGEGQGLKSLEVRAAPSVYWTNYLQYGREYWDCCHEIIAASKASGVPTPLVEIGFVLHFIRRRGFYFEKGMIGTHGIDTAADPRANVTKYRFGDLYKQFSGEGTNLTQLLMAYPDLLRLIRGIDACNDENGVPLWVVVPHMRKVVSASEAICSGRNLGTPSHCKPLRTTIHVGENFVHLLTGVRRIAEVLDQLQLRETDRLGHAIAAGIDVEEWLKEHPKVFMVSEDRLWDLVWEHGIYKHNAVVADASRMKYVESCIERLAEEIFQINRPTALNQMELLYEDLFDEKALITAGYPNGNGRNNSDQSRSLLRKYLTNAAVFSRGQKPISVDTSREAAALTSIQGWLVGRIADRGLVIEVNPSSNLSVGKMGNLKKHPIVRFSGLLAANQRGTTEIIVGSDDPLCFSSALPSEFAHLLSGLINAGVAPTAAMSYLDGRCSTSWDSRYTLPLE